ncbi:hypothetical protein NP493_172g03080 [Ridgeia piscesae]|uniref:Etoposide-induced protein 2.4 n=1 Tax=Ridgeia piscesae TaxID=27915 RepID=A0AAD9P3G3_RIDPI|nr:hypothetical protein NP493_172g03080 [Ridgeia piscesae]
MSTTAKLMLLLVARGVRDSFMGILKLHRLDEDVHDESTSSSSRKDEPLSALARRRSEHLKHTERKHDSSEPRVLQRMLLCCAWNGGLFLLSILVFNGLIIPGLQFFIHLIFGGSSTHNIVWSWVGPMLSWTFSALWVLPLFLLSKLVNSLWFQDIADAAYRRTRGRPQMLPTFGKIIADIIFSLLLQGLFLIQGTLAVFLPITVIGQLISLLHMCLLYSLYAFEYKWFSMGWEVHKRLSYVESNWPYFVGFGLPLAVFTSISSSAVINGCVFSMVFPLLIISGNEAEPIDETFNYPLRLFTPVVIISNAIFQHSVKRTNVHQVAHPSQSASATHRQVRLQER